MLDGYAALSGGREVPGAVARLWDAAGSADATPARDYLSRRGCWPGRHVPGAPPLPAEAVRWLAREAVPERDEAEGWHGLPPGAAGAVVFAWRRSGVQDGPPVAVTLVALDARDGRTKAAFRAAWNGAVLALEAEGTTWATQPWPSTGGSAVTRATVRKHGGAGPQMRTRRVRRLRPKICPQSSKTWVPVKDASPSFLRHLERRGSRATGRIQRKIGSKHRRGEPDKT